MRHSYAPGWLLPGGGVERGETIYEALARELEEEGGIVLDGAPVFHGLFSNEEKFRGDHVACFVIREFTRRAWKQTVEIKETGFFPVTSLPEGTTGRDPPANRRGRYRQGAASSLVMCYLFTRYFVRGMGAAMTLGAAHALRACDDETGRRFRAFRIAPVCGQAACWAPAVSDLRNPTCPALS